MKRTFSVTRIFNLGNYQNLQLTQSMEVDAGEWGDMVTTLDDEEGLSETDIPGYLVNVMLRDIYAAAIDHQAKLDAMKEVESKEEKLQVFGVRY